jgi:hypothetical protein
LLQTGLFALEIGEKDSAFGLESAVFRVFYLLMRTHDQVCQDAYFVALDLINAAQKAGVSG